MLAPAPARFTAGPLEVVLECDDGAILALASNALRLFSTPWPVLSRRIVVHLIRESRPLDCSGTYLTCARSRIDRSDSLFCASAISGITATGKTSGARDEWRISVPPQLRFGEAESGDIEDVILLALTVAWRAAGWEPVHAAAAAKDGRCVLLCAASGGGKSTLTAALVRNGWRALGDDKLLMRTENGKVELASLMRTFNLHPRSAQWFSELDGIAELPRYSAWTPKRRVNLETLAHWSAIDSAAITHVVVIERTAMHSGVVLRPVEPNDAVAAVLRQIVIPNDRAVAGAAMRQCARVAQTSVACKLEIGEDAYARVDVASELEAYLE